MDGEKGVQRWVYRKHGEGIRGRDCIHVWGHSGHAHVEMELMGKGLGVEGDLGQGP